MSECTQKKDLLPRRRFPEFAKSEAWKSRPLSQVLDYEQPTPYLVDSERYEKTGTAVLTANKSFILGYTSDTKGVFLRLPAIIFDDFTTDKKFVVFPFKVKSSAIKILLPKSGFNLYFLHEAMRQISFTPQDHKRHWISQYQQFSIPVPDDEEQRKIAHCLESLDDLIAAETQKLEALKRHKKGLLQQLFPAEGETTPRLRFPGYSSGWRGVPLAELLSEPPSYGLNAAATAYQPTLSLYLRITDIDEEGRYIAEGRVSVAQAVTNDAYLQQGDIAVARTGASVGKSYFCDDADGPFVYAGFLIRLRADPSKLLPTLLAQWLRSDGFWRWVTLTSARSGQPGINGTEYASVEIPVPTGPLAIKEQQAIASCLFAEDAVIGSLRERLAKLRTHKAALMQQLFP